MKFYLCRWKRIVRWGSWGYLFFVVVQNEIARKIIRQLLALNANTDNRFPFFVCIALVQNRHQSYDFYCSVLLKQQKSDSSYCPVPLSSKRTTLSQFLLFCTTLIQNRHQSNSSYCSVTLRKQSNGFYYFSFCTTLGQNRPKSNNFYCSVPRKIKTENSLMVSIVLYHLRQKTDKSLTVLRSKQATV